MAVRMIRKMLGPGTAAVTRLTRASDESDRRGFVMPPV
jgi:hypothetical protein